MKSRKKIIWGIIVLVVVVFVYYKFFRSANKVEAETFIIKKGSVEKTLSVSGNLKPKNSADLSFEVPTLISWVGVQVGDKVKKGQALVKIDKNSVVANVKEAQVTLEKAIESEKLARRKWDTYKPEEKAQFKKTTEEVRYRLNSIQAQLSKGTLVSPIDGVVTKQEARKGEVAQGVVTRIMGGEGLEIESLVSEADIVEFYEGQEAEVTFDALGSSKEFSAKVKQIYQEAVNLQDVVYFKTIFEMKKVDESIKSGMTADLDVLASKKDNVLVVPLRFIRRDDQGSYVFIKKFQEKQNLFQSTFAKKEMESEKRYIQTGIESDDGLMEILSGVKEGEELVLVYEK